MASETPEQDRKSSDKDEGEDHFTFVYWAARRNPRKRPPSLSEVWKLAEAARAGWRKFLDAVFFEKSMQAVREEEDGPTVLMAARFLFDLLDDVRVALAQINNGEGPALEAKERILRMLNGMNESDKKRLAINLKLANRTRRDYAGFVKELVTELHRLHPDWSNPRIAKELEEGRNLRHLRSGKPYTARYVGKLRNELGLKRKLARKVPIHD